MPLSCKCNKSPQTAQITTLWKTHHFSASVTSPHQNSTNYHPVEDLPVSHKPVSHNSTNYPSVVDLPFPCKHNKSPQTAQITMQWKICRFHASITGHLKSNQPVTEGVAPGMAVGTAPGDTEGPVGVAPGSAVGTTGGQGRQ